MKHLFLILFVALTAIVATSTQSETVKRTAQSYFEEKMLNDVVAPAVLTEDNLVADRILTSPDMKPKSVDILNYSCKKNQKYPLLNPKHRQINYAGFGSFLYTGGAQDSITIEQTEDPANNNWPSFIQWILNHKAILLSLALALSEVLALIPGIQQNGIFQSVFTFLKSKQKKV